MSDEVKLLTALLRVCRAGRRYGTVAMAQAALGWEARFEDRFREIGVPVPATSAMKRGRPSKAFLEDAAQQESGVEA